MNKFLNIAAGAIVAGGLALSALPAGAVSLPRHSTPALTAEAAPEATIENVRYYGHRRWHRGPVVYFGYGRWHHRRHHRHHRHW